MFLSRNEAKKERDPVKGRAPSRGRESYVPVRCSGSVGTSLKPRLLGGTFRVDGVTVSPKLVVQELAATVEIVEAMGTGVDVDCVECVYGHCSVLC